ncbi:hypothetical protein DXG03_002099 [Asterophora parasitica]|uniref:Uncharacterized protein n=1 Tax=Asterophora parasitica TaxID=117018 RepID=A0A9P7KB69_9AGAR|nr:hypothetical protein DXG03_002099 [Asterophora parasitica]
MGDKPPRQLYRCGGWIISHDQAIDWAGRLLRQKNLEFIAATAVIREHIKQNLGCKVAVVKDRGTTHLMFVCYDEMWMDWRNGSTASEFTWWKRRKDAVVLQKQLEAMRKSPHPQAFAAVL